MESNVAADNTVKCLLLVNANRESHETLGSPSPPERSLLRGESKEDRSPDGGNSREPVRTALESVNEISLSSAREWLSELAMVAKRAWVCFGLKGGREEGGPNLDERVGYNIVISYVYFASAFFVIACGLLRSMCRRDLCHE